jgi:hypothetical protein
MGPSAFNVMLYCALEAAIIQNSKKSYINSEEIKEINNTLVSCCRCNEGIK